MMLSLDTLVGGRTAQMEMDRESKKGHAQQACSRRPCLKEAVKRASSKLPGRVAIQRQQGPLEMRVGFVHWVHA